MIIPAEQHQTWWQKNKQLLISAIVIISVLLLAFALVIYLFGWDWTGFTGGTSKITKTPQGTTTEYSPGKNLWDWMQLLIIPLVLAVAVFWLNQMQRGREQRTTQQQAELERELTRDNQAETLLQAYIDKISELLLEKQLRESQPENEVRKLARVRTLTVLHSLDAKRQASVLKFLYESSLIDKDKFIIDLSGVNLSGADLEGAELIGVRLVDAMFAGNSMPFVDLHDADLTGANIWGANLNNANLSGANLSGANLPGVNLIAANLSGANLSGATIWGSNLVEADLKGANLTAANLKGSLFGEAWQKMSTQITGDLFYAAVKEIANLGGSDLSGADLSGADLSGAEVTPEQLEQAKSLEGATMPDGSIHP